MFSWIICPYCGTMMTPYTNFTQCNLCGYRIPPQTVTLRTGTAKPKNIAEGKKAYTADTSVLKIRKEDGLTRCKDCCFYKEENLQCMMHEGDTEEWYDNDYCSRAERKEE